MPLAIANRQLTIDNVKPSHSLWRQRESALIWGAPLTVAPALVVVPVTISLLIDPIFPWARIAGVAILTAMGVSEIAGLSRLALTLHREFDALTFFAAGVVLTMWAIVACSGVLLGIVLTN